MGKDIFNKTYDSLEDLVEQLYFYTMKKEPTDEELKTIIVQNSKLDINEETLDKALNDFQASLDRKRENFIKKIERTTYARKAPKELSKKLKHVSQTTTRKLILGVSSYIMLIISANKKELCFDLDSFEDLVFLLKGDLKDEFEKLVANTMSITDDIDANVNFMTLMTREIAEYYCDYYDHEGKNGKAIKERIENYYSMTAEEIEKEVKKIEQGNKIYQLF